ncbi:phage holin family protein [Chryseobacterium salipaludis]|uniref:phage holin family protein n=1 Tax=Chryseobacterium TaxID=59732 RepID=UPI001FF1FD22|nr:MULTISPECIES: phage holin family protein [Chryseobacterium]MCJ8496684.1 phage holin family protein [Chryseobacterium salipaludis]MCX3296165.1 phage holin family protein [Planobacterium sp. JC490]
MIEIIKEYISKRIDLIKMEITEKVTLSAGVVLLGVLISIAFLFFIILLNIGLGLLIGYWLGNYAYGMLIMAGIYLLIIVVLFLSRKAIKDSVANMIIKNLN